jgi:hypothetical protein
MRGGQLYCGNPKQRQSGELQQNIRKKSAMRPAAQYDTSAEDDEAQKERHIWKRNLP